MVATKLALCFSIDISSHLFYVTLSILIYPFFTTLSQELLGMIEPAMTVILGVMLGWVMLSVLGPIYDILGKIT